MFPPKLTPTAQLPAATCGYKQFHIDDLVTGATVGTADGVTLSPDGTKAAVPLLVNGKFEVNSMNLDGTELTCLTCGQGGPNDGARWRPVSKWQHQNRDAWRRDESDAAHDERPRRHELPRQLVA